MAMESSVYRPDAEIALIAHRLRSKVSERELTRASIARPKPRRNPRTLIAPQTGKRRQTGPPFENSPEITTVASTHKVAQAFSLCTGPARRRILRV
jgi:hypothetical protein